MLSLNSEGSSVSEDSPNASMEDVSRIPEEHQPVFLNKPVTSQKADDRFATIRPAQFVARQMYEHQGSDQMQVYKRLRQQHQKLIIQLEQRQQQEMYEHKKALEREFENHMH